MRERVTPEAVLTARREAHAEGHRLTYRRLANIVTDDRNESHDCIGPECSRCYRNAVLLRQAADQILRTRRSRAQGHPNGRRGYSGTDRRSVDRSRTAQVHGARPVTAL